MLQIAVPGASTLMQYSRRLRRVTTVDPALFIGKIADTYERQQLLEKRALLYWREFGAPGVDVYDGMAIHVVCLRGTDVIGAVRLLGPTPLPLEVPAFRKLAKSTVGLGRLMQIGGLWLDPLYWRVSTATLRFADVLFGRSVSIARALGAAGLILRTSEPARAKWYAALGFERVQWLDYHDAVWGAVYTMYRPLSKERGAAFLPHSGVQPREKRQARESDDR